MRILVKKLLTSSNISFARFSSIRQWSSDKKKEKADEVKKTDEVLQRSKVIFFTYLFRELLLCGLVLWLVCQAAIIIMPKDIFWELALKFQYISDIIVEKYNGITTLNINRIDTRNSLDELTLREIETALNDFDKDDNAKVLIFHGEGGSLCSGFDIDEIGEKGYNTLMDASVRQCNKSFLDNYINVKGIITLCMF